ncbi:TPA: hypothetical protein ACGY76_003303 [Clostridioides difficile]
MNSAIVRTPPLGVVPLVYRFPSELARIMFVKESDKSKKLVAL